MNTAARGIASFALLVLTFALVACGGSNDKDAPSGTTVTSTETASVSTTATDVSPTPTAVLSEPTEASLRAYLGNVDQALKDRDWQELYSLSSEEYQENCDLADFIGILLFAQAFIGEDFFDAENQISDVVIEGNRATFTSTRVLDGSVIEISEESLLFKDGRWVEDDPGEGCGGDIDSSFGGSTDIAFDLSTLAESSASTTEAEFTSDMVSIVVHRVMVADYEALYEASDDAGKRRLDDISDSDGAITIGQIEISVQNLSDERKSVYPDQATVVVGNEQVETSFFLSDDLGGEYFPGVLKEGKVFFFLERTEYDDVTKVLYAVDSPFGDTFNFDAPDFELTIDIP